MCNRWYLISLIAVLGLHFFKFQVLSTPSLHFQSPTLYFQPPTGCNCDITVFSVRGVNMCSRWCGWYLTNINLIPGPLFGGIVHAFYYDPTQPVNFCIHHLQLTKTCSEWGGAMCMGSLHSPVLL